MPVLTNTRHERFAQELAEGKSAMQAYRDAGYSDHSAHKSAWRLQADAGIQERVRELQEAQVQDTRMTLQRLTRQLMEDRALALKNGQAAAAVQAERVLAKIHGLDVERIEATHRTISGDAMRPEDWASEYAGQDEETPHAPH